MKQAVTVSIADDHKLFRTALIGLIEEIDNFHVEIEAENGQDLLDKLNDATITDIVLVDIEMPILDGPRTVRALKERYGNDIKILALSMHQEYRLVNEMMQCGANGFLSKNADIDELRKALTNIYNNDYYLNEEMSKLVVGKHYKTFDTSETLSEIEERILVLVCEQHTNAEIANLLNLSTNTINSYRTRILDKVGATNTAGLVIFAIKNNLYKI